MDASHVETKPTDLKDRVECGLFVSMKGRGWKMGNRMGSQGWFPSEHKEEQQVPPKEDDSRQEIKRLRA